MGNTLPEGGTMRIILDFFKKSGHLFLSILSRLRVFYQILLIIIIMVGFILLEGYLGLKVIDQMQQVSSNVFNSTVDGFMKTLLETCCI